MNPQTNPGQFNVPAQSGAGSAPQSAMPPMPNNMPIPPQAQNPMPPAPNAMPATQPMGYQPGQQFAQSQMYQSNTNQQQVLTQQQAAMNTMGTQTLASQAPEGQQALTGQAQAPKVIENPISTQSTLLISELRDGLVIMKDGSFRAVVACQSINFDLMSEQEREGVEYSYQNFLNSLNFNVQILVRSQRVDIGPYIDRLTTIRRNNDNMLLGVLMDDYINFIDLLSQEANIMDKSFFVVIPYYSSADAEAFVNQTKNLFKTFGKKAPEVTRINRDTYNKAVDELNNRVEAVVSGLFQIGIQSVRLNTRELSELYYNFNNPDTAVREPLVDFSKLATTYVRKGEKPNA